MGKLFFSNSLNKIVNNATNKTVNNTMNKTVNNTMNKNTDSIINDVLSKFDKNLVSYDAKTNMINMVVPASRIRKDRFTGEFALSKFGTYSANFKNMNGEDSWINCQPKYCLNTDNDKFYTFTFSPYRNANNGCFDTSSSFNTMRSMDVDKYTKACRKYLEFVKPITQSIVVKPSTLHRVELSYEDKELITDIKSKIAYEIFSSKVSMYNKCCDFVEKYDIPVDDIEAYNSEDYYTDTYNIKALHIDDSLITLYDKCHDYAVKNGIDLAELPNISSYDTVSASNSNNYNNTLTYEQVTEKFNNERGLSVFDENGEVKLTRSEGKTFEASYKNKYAFSNSEIAKLLRGESIILSEVVNDTSTGFDNVRVKLLEVDEGNTTNGCNYQVVPVSFYQDITSDGFADEYSNEKYRCHKCEYDMAIAAITVHGKELIDHLETKYGDIKAKKLIDAKVKSSEEHGFDKKGSISINTKNYFPMQWCDTTSFEDSVLIKRRCDQLVQATKDRLSALPATDKGVRLGFENRYDELKFKHDIKYTAKSISDMSDKLEIAKATYTSEAKIKMIESFLDTQKSLYEDLKTERDERSKPVTDESYIEKGASNAWEERVIKYHEEHTENMISRDERFSNQYKLLQAKILNNANKAKTAETEQDKSVDICT